MSFLWQYLVTGGLFVAIDSLWIGIVMNKFYKKQLGGLLREKPSFPPAVIFYLVYMLAIVVFIVRPALEQSSLSVALGHGALLGLAMYCTYDLTNASTLKGWPKSVTVVDIVWGTFITTLVGVLTFVIFN